MACSWTALLYYDTKGDDNPAPQDIILEEMYVFLALILNMGHDQ
jgi:hypothetical protein